MYLTGRRDVAWAAVLYFHPPGMPTEAARRAMTMFAEQIMPDTRGWGGTN